jgi:hypothetical protein
LLSHFSAVRTIAVLFERWDRILLRIWNLSATGGRVPKLTGLYSVMQVCLFGFCPLRSLSSWFVSARNIWLCWPWKGSDVHKYIVKSSTTGCIPNYRIALLQLYWPEKGLTFIPAP